MARFLSYDPDGRAAWLHSGTTTVQVSLEQLRGAFGFEHWQPTREDQQALTDAAASIRQDIWQDHRSTAPPPDEDQCEYALEHEIDMVPEQQQATVTAADNVVYPLAPPPTPKQPRQSTSSISTSHSKTPQQKSTCQDTDNTTEYTSTTTRPSAGQPTETRYNPTTHKQHTHHR